MLKLSSNEANVLPSTVINFSSNINTKDKEVNSKELVNAGILKSKMDLSIDLFKPIVSQISLTLKDIKYLYITTHAKNGSNALFERDNNKLKKIEQEFFVKGDKNKYIDQNELNYFIQALFNKNLGEKNKSLIQLTDEGKNTLKKNIKFINKKINNIEKQIPILRINVSNVAELSKLVQDNIILSNDFEEEISKRMRAISKFNENTITRITNDFTKMLRNKTFGTINEDTITVITQNDLLTMYHLKENIIKVDEYPLTKDAAHKKMLQKFIFKNDIYINAKAINYIIGGRDINNIPVMYSSEGLRLSKSNSEFEFNKLYSEAKGVLNELNKPIGFVLDKNDAIYYYAFLKNLNNEIIESNNLKDNDALQRKKSILKTINNEYFKDNQFAQLLENINIKNLSKIVDLMNLKIKGEYISKFEINLSKNNENILLNNKSTPINYRDIYIPNSNKQLLSLGADASIVKKNFGDKDDEIKSTFGYKPLSITSYKIDKDKYIPIKFASVATRFSAEERLGDIIEKLSKLNNEGKIKYEEKEYSIDISKNIKNFEKAVNSLLYKKASNEIKNTKKGISAALIDAKDSLLQTLKYEKNIQSFVTQIKETIENNPYLKIIQEVGEYPTMSYNQKMQHMLAGRNKIQINNHIKQNEYDLLSKYHNQKINVPGNSSSPFVNKAILSEFTRIEKNAQFMKRIDDLDYKVFANRVVAFEKKLEMEKPETARYLLNKDSTEIANIQKYYTISKFIKDMVALNASKYTGETKSLENIFKNKSKDILLKAYYPENKKIKNSSEVTFDIKSTSIDVYKKYLRKLESQNKKFYTKVNNNISKKLELLNTHQNDISYIFEDNNKEKKNISENKQEVSTSSKKNKDQEVEINNNVNISIDELDIPDDYNNNEKSDLTNNNIDLDSIDFSNNNENDLGQIQMS